MIQYPEHDKLQKIGENRNVIGEFLEWMFTLYSIESHSNPKIFGESITIENLLAQYYEIDMQKLREEKELMYKAIQEINNKV